jgi:hypothetical protein
LKSTLGIYVLKVLDSLIPIHKLDYPVRLKVITALAAFTRRQDPWTTEEAFNDASKLLLAYKSAVFKEKEQSLPALLGDILKTVVKPAFAKTKNIGITSAGRKNEHPVPAPRFDASVFDESSKPWKFKDVHDVTVLSWIVDQYSVRRSVPRTDSSFELALTPCRYQIIPISRRNSRFSCLQSCH